jgi:hypothetical protein
VYSNVPEQHGAAMEHTTVGLKPTRSRQEPACTSGMIPKATLATKGMSEVAAFRFLYGLSMAFFIGKFTLIIPRDAATV